MAIEKEEKKLLFEIDGFKVYEKTIYKVVGKKDKNAPDGLVDLGVCKFPFKDNFDIVYCAWDKFTQTFDTGFHEHSMCYNSVDDDFDVKKFIKNITETILKPAEKVLGIGKLSHTNVDFWDEHSIKLVLDAEFNTANPIEALNLYLALKDKKLTPKEKDGDPYYMESFFCVEGIQQTYNEHRTRSLEKIKIRGTFEKLARSSDVKDVQKAVDILVYADIIRTPLSLEEPDFIVLMFEDWINARVDNLDKYANIHKRSMESDFSDILKINRQLTFLMGRGSIQQSKEGLTFKNAIIGADTKTTAERLVKDTTRAEILQEIMDEYESKFKND